MDYILSVTLFGIRVDSIVKCLASDTNCYLYVDNFLICFGGGRWQQLSEITIKH